VGRARANAEQMSFGGIGTFPLSAPRKRPFRKELVRQELEEVRG
jgi:hypothetical protein